MSLIFNFFHQNTHLKLKRGYKKQWKNENLKQIFLVKTFKKWVHTSLITNKWIQSFLFLIFPEVSSIHEVMGNTILFALITLYYDEQSLLRIPNQDCQVRQK